MTDRDKQEDIFSNHKDVTNLEYMKNDNFYNDDQGFGLQHLQLFSEVDCEINKKDVLINPLKHNIQPLFTDNPWSVQKPLVHNKS